MKKLLFITLLVLLSSCGSSSEVKKRMVHTPDPPVEKAPIDTPMKPIGAVPKMNMF